MSENEKPAMAAEDILRMIPHRYPFLLVDRVLDYDLEARTLTARKNVTFNEPFFQGHFPDHPLMPGVLLIEAMAQACGLLAFLSKGSESGDDNMNYLVKVDNARFKHMVRPGDTLTFEVAQKRIVRGMGLYATRASVDGREVASAELMCASRK